MVSIYFSHRDGDDADNDDDDDDDLLFFSSRWRLWYERDKWWPSWTEVGEAINPFQPGVALAGSLQGDNESPRKRSVEGNTRRNVNDGWVRGGGCSDEMMAGVMAMVLIMVMAMVVMMIRRRKSRVTHHIDAMRGHAEIIEMSVKNDRWWRSNLKIALIP